jgi:hypothetical protein
MQEMHQVVTATNVQRTWAELRKEMRRARFRDVVDWLEYDANPSVWIRRLVTQVKSGVYEPRTPRRLKLAKSNGFSRTITIPTVEDAVLLRLLVDYLFQKVEQRQCKHVYFDQAQHAKLQQQAEDNAKDTERGRADSAGYWFTRENSFEAWLRFSQYRKYLIFEDVYPFIVTTDISNFFDTVLHDRLQHALHEISAPSALVGLLFLCLERLSLRHPYAPNLRIGLPVDEYGVSRKLAHLLLFPHDNRIVSRVGENAYVRWMDDQLIGVQTRADGLRLLGLVGQSLGLLNLTANAKKSRVLTLAQARDHFHLVTNGRLDELEKLPFKTDIEKKSLRARLQTEWKRAKTKEGDGEWGKILKRFYRLFARANDRRFRKRAIRDVLDVPELVQRVVEYVRYTGSGQEYFSFVMSLIEHDEMVYEDLPYFAISGLLQEHLERPHHIAARDLGRRLIVGTQRNCSAVHVRALGPLLLLRFGDKRALRTLESVVDKDRATSPHEVTRAAALVYASEGPENHAKVERWVAQMVHNPIALCMGLLSVIQKYQDVPAQFASRAKVSTDGITFKKFMDFRSLLSIRLLRVSSHPNVEKWLNDKRREIVRKVTEKREAALVSYLLSR